MHAKWAVYVVTFKVTRPGGQSRHNVLLSGANFPVAQTLQPYVVEGNDVFPSVHSLHELPGLGAEKPSLHTLHLYSSAVGSSWNCPPMHCMQGVDPLTGAIPGPHVWQAFTVAEVWS